MAAFVAASACQAPAPNLSATPTTPQPGGTLVVALRGDLGAWNPYTVEDDATAHVLDLVYPRLLHESWREGGLSFVPWAAQSWSASADGRTMTLTLRDTARWSNAAPITCEDVAFTHALRRDPQLAWSGASEAAKATLAPCRESRTLEFQFERATLDAWFAVNDDALVPHSYRDVEPSRWHDTDWSQRWVGAGPYRLQSVTPGQEAVLVRDDNWWGAPQPYIDRVVLRVYPDETLALDALEHGEIDLLERVPPLRARALKTNPNVRVVDIPALTETQIVWNTLESNAYLADRQRRGCAEGKECREDENDIHRLQQTAPHPILSEPAVRHALTLALDRRDLIAGLLAGYGQAGDTPVLSSLWAHDGAAAPEYDPASARRELDAAGWVDLNRDGVREKNGRKLRIALLTNAESASKRDIAERCAVMLKLIGVELQVEAVPRGVYAQRARDKRFDALLIGMRIGTALSVGLHTRDAVSRGLNMGSWSSPESDALLDRTAQAASRDAAKPLWAAWQQLVRRDRPVTVLYEERALIGLSARLQDATPSPLDPYDNLPAWWITPR